MVKYDLIDIISQVFYKYTLSVLLLIIYQCLYLKIIKAHVLFKLFFWYEI